MLRRTIWAGIAVLMVVVMVLAACTPTTTETGGSTTTVTGKVTSPETPIDQKPPPPLTPSISDEPQYGGTISFASGQTGGFDPANVLNFWPGALLSYETLVSEDWTKGPSGSNVTPLASNYTPPEYYVGWLAESWQILDLNNITFTLRKGIRWMSKPPVNGRELVADDVVFTMNRNKATPQHSTYDAKQPPEKQTTIVAVDKYTVKITVADANPYILLLGWINCQIVPKEAVAAPGGLTDWRNMNTTGPYYVSDVVPDSSVTFKKNEGYWATDPFRPNNKLPYVDQLKSLVILDQATQLSALRTGKIDRLGLTKEQATSMIRTNPELKYRRLPPSLTNILHMRTDIKDGPFANVKVRQALSMSIDRQAIIKDYYLGDAEILNWPFQTTAGPGLYTPLDQLPQKLQDLYTYNPTKAKQLLAEAGYPGGFKTTINLLANYAGGAELYSIVKSYFDAIGVDTTISVLEAGAYWSVLVGHTYKDMTVSAWGNSHPNGGIAANTAGYLYNYSIVNDEFVEKERVEINKIVDVNERNVRLKALGQYLIEQVYYVELPSPYGYAFWQPWLKGQNGEVQHGAANNWYGFAKFSWIDKDLKQSITGRSE